MTGIYVDIGNRGFSATEAADAAGITYRQIDYWATSGFIVPSKPAKGSGSQRRYTVAEVRQLEVAGRLAGWGVSLQRLRKLTPVQREELLAALFQAGLVGAA